MHYKLQITTRKLHWSAKTHIAVQAHMVC